MTIRSLLLTGLASLSLIGALPAHAQLSYTPHALGWSTEEVTQASQVNRLDLQQLARSQDLDGCQRHCDRLQRVFTALVQAASIHNPPMQGLAWTLHIVRLPEVDAMALPGGHLLISEALIDQGGLDDAQLGFVLAHEMAHVLLEHERQLLSYARQLLPREVRRSVRDMYVELDHNFGLLKSLEPVLQQGELEADELGLLLASAAGFQPDAQLRFLEREAGRPAERRALLQTHPAALRRLQALQQRLPLAQGVLARSWPTP